MKKITMIGLSTLSIAAVLALAACGGGGDGGSSSTGSTGSGSGSSGGGSTPVAVTGTLPSPQYAQGSAQLAAFNLLNQYRTQCGFPALQENTVLDQAAQAHAKYLGANNTITDTEVSGNTGFTGATYVARAVTAGFPSTANGSGASGGNTSQTASFSATASGQEFVYSLIAGVYHSGVVLFPVDTVGIGEYETQATSSGITWTSAWQSLSLINTQTQTLGNSPVTFPCQGVTGVPYKSTGESPTPPNVSGSGWGTPVVVMGNSTDTIMLQSGTMTDTSGNVLSLQLLNSTNDPNKIVQAYEAVAYPASALLPNTTYSVSITGTVNGSAFSRNFSFTTGNIAG
ncbi:CAP domain-containing protein [Burkholderia sp. PR2]|uniref:CAP domain-containing protein n=1 Tax=Burkholderia sp. PR2 TaxID=3448078 RepID=UPI00402ABA12